MVILSPVFKPNLEPPVPAAFFETVTVWLKSQFSIITVAVMILVVEAIFTLLYSFLPNIIFLLFLSKTTQERAFKLSEFPSLAKLMSKLNKSISIKSKKNKFFIRCLKNILPPFKIYEERFINMKMKNIL